MADEQLLEDHFRHPRNAGVLDGADLEVRVENPVCGDILHLSLRRDPDGRVEACRFQVYGCPAAIAAGSVLTELLDRATAEAARRVSAETIGESLGGLDPERQHAAVLAADAAAAAVARW